MSRLSPYAPRTRTRRAPQSTRHRHVADGGHFTSLSFSLAAALLLGVLDSVGLLPGSASVRSLICVVTVACTLLIDIPGIPIRGRLGVLTVIGGCLFGVYLSGLAASAAVRGVLSPDNVVVIVLACVPLLVGLVVKMRLKTRGIRPVGVLLLKTSAVLWATRSLLDAATATAGVPLEFFSHERCFIALVILFIPAGRWYLAVRIAMLLAIAISMYKYPAATTAIVLLAAALTYLVMAVSRTTLRVGLAAVIAATAVVASSNNVLLERFYQMAGRTDNSSTREYLWAQATASIERSPLLGGAASTPIVAINERSGDLFLLPIHNTWLTLGMIGGVLAIVIFGLTLGSALLAGLVSKRPSALWLPALMGAAVTLSVNPTLDRPDTSLTFWLLVCSAVVLEPHIEKATKI